MSKQMCAVAAAQKDAKRVSHSSASTSMRVQVEAFTLYFCIGCYLIKMPSVGAMGAGKWAILPLFLPATIASTESDCRSRVCPMGLQLRPRAVGFPLTDSFGNCIGK